MGGESDSTATNQMKPCLGTSTSWSMRTVQSDPCIRSSQILITARMRKLVWAVAVHIYHLVLFPTQGLKWPVYVFSTKYIISNT